MKRIFVRAISRSGGTLLTTVLDAHPQVAMSYEVYEHLLSPSDEAHEGIATVIEALKAATAPRSLLRNGGNRRIDNRHLQTFVGRAMRGGIEPKRLLHLLEQHAAEGQGLADFRDRSLFVERMAVDKMHREGKRHWGVKINTRCEDMAELWPDAYFLFMLRDGRDIAASRKNVGEFNQTAAQVARGWGQNVQKFREFAEQTGTRARMVRYERLTDEPEAELREVFEFLDLPWDDRVLNFHQQDLSIYRNPSGHLSAEQLTHAINSGSVGRWKKDLTAEEIAAFEQEAGDLLEGVGYERS